MLVCNKVRNWKFVCKTHHSFQKGCQFYTLKMKIILAEKTLDTTDRDTSFDSVNADYQRITGVDDLQLRKLSNINQLIHLYASRKSWSSRPQTRQKFFFWFMSWQILDLMILNYKIMILTCLCEYVKLITRSWFQVEKAQEHEWLLCFYKTWT